MFSNTLDHKTPMQSLFDRVLQTIVALGLFVACAYYAAEESLRQRKLNNSGEGE